MKIFFVCFFIFGLAYGTPFDLDQHPTLNVELRVVDAKKLDARAVTLLRADGLTLEQARAKVRTDGVINPAKATDEVLRHAVIAASPYLQIDRVQVVIER